jgi:hypothetical protein
MKSIAFMATALTAEGKFFDGGQLAQMTARKVNLQIHGICVRGLISDLRLASKYFVQDLTK